MSDLMDGTRTTAQAPPTPPGGAPPAPSGTKGPGTPGGKVPGWVIAGVSVAVLVAGAAIYAATGGFGTTPSPSPTPVEVGVVTPTATVEPPTPAPTEPPDVTLPKPNPSANFVKYCFVRKVIGSAAQGWAVSLDFVEVLTGQAAIDYARSQEFYDPLKGGKFVKDVDFNAVPYRLAKNAAVLDAGASGTGKGAGKLSMEDIRAWTEGKSSPLSSGALFVWKAKIVKGYITRLQMTNIEG